MVPRKGQTSGDSRCGTLLFSAIQMISLTTALIRKGVMCISDLFDTNFCPRQDVLPKIGITWREVYTSSIKQFCQLMPTDWSIPSVWVGSSGKSASLKKLSPMPYVPRRQPSFVWKPFWASWLPPFLKDFVYPAL